MTTPAGGSSLTDWLTAVGTVSAAALALIFGAWGWIHGRFIRPDLILSIAMEPPDCQHIRMTNGVQSYFFRLRITNEGKQRADQVEVHLLKLWRASNAGSYLPDPDFIPLNLLWANIRETVAPRIAAKGISRHCDLCCVVEGKALMEFVTEVRPNEVRPGVWPTSKSAGHYKLDLAVSAENTDPVYESLEIDFAGKWFDDPKDMFAQGMSIRVL